MICGTVFLSVYAVTVRLTDCSSRATCVRKEATTDGRAGDDGASEDDGDGHADRP